MQTTLGSDFSFSGIGVFSGDNVSFTARPSGPDTGMVFQRNGHDIPARIDLVEEVPNRTKLVSDGESIQVVEHLLAALRGMGVDNALIETDSIELPILDASAKDYVDAIRRVGVIKQDSLKKELLIHKPIFIEEDSLFIGIFPDSEPRITYYLDHEHPQIGRQTDSMPLNVENFSELIGLARTFVTEEEAKLLIRKKVVGIDDTYVAILVSDDGFNKPLRHAKEMVHHKMLDMIGDLSLAYWPIIGHIIGIRSGHFANRKLARKIAEMIK
jgi:UDP-3-O-acyl N-acetylglucosamine deacetylase